MSSKQSEDPDPNSQAEPTVSSQRMGSVAVLWGIFLEPAAAFRQIAKHPTWFLPLLATLVLVLVFNIILIDRMGIGNIIRASMQGDPRADQLAELAEASSLSKVMLYVAPLVSTPLFLLAIAGLFLLAFSLSGKDVTFKKSLAVVCHSFFAYSVVSTFLMLLTVFFAGDLSQLDLRNPIASNLGFFLDPSDIGKFLYNVASSIDVLSLWMVFLLITGFVAVSSNLRATTARAVVLSLWCAYVLLKSIWAAAFGR
ncbi:MAG: YIP1 family protein [Acidobacteriota bacterium]